MKKIITLVLAALMCLACFTACGQGSDLAYVKKNGELVIGITIYDPMNYYMEDGTTLTGFDTDFANEVCKRLGVKANFVVIDWNTKETELKSKNIDAIWNGLTVTEERRENMDFTTSYLINKQCIVVPKDKADAYNSTEDFAEKMLAAEKGSAGATAIETDAGLKKGKFTAAADQSKALQELLSGNVDAAVIDYTMAKATVGNGDFANYAILDIELPNEEYAIGFRVGSDLTAEVNKIIAEMIEDGSLAKIAEKYDMTELYNEAVKD